MTLEIFFFEILPLKSYQRQNEVTNSTHLVNKNIFFCVIPKTNELNYHQRHAALNRMKTCRPVGKSSYQHCEQTKTIIGLEINDQTQMAIKS